MMAGFAPRNLHTSFGQSHGPIINIQGVKLENSSLG
jgi:hypothetical protein